MMSLNPIREDLVSSSSTAGKSMKTRYDKAENCKNKIKWEILKKSVETSEKTIKKKGMFN